MRVLSLCVSNNLASLGNEDPKAFISASNPQTEATTEAPADQNSHPLPAIPFKGIALNMPSSLIRKPSDLSVGSISTYGSYGSYTGSTCSPRSLESDKSSVTKSSKSALPEWKSCHPHLDRLMRSHLSPEELLYLHNAVVNIHTMNIKTLSEGIFHCGSGSFILMIIHRGFHILTQLESIAHLSSAQQCLKSKTTDGIHHIIVIFMDLLCEIFEMCHHLLSFVDIFGPYYAWFIVFFHIGPVRSKFSPKHLQLFSLFTKAFRIFDLLEPISSYRIKAARDTIHMCIKSAKLVLKLPQKRKKLKKKKQPFQITLRKKWDLFHQKVDQSIYSTPFADEIQMINLFSKNLYIPRLLPVYETVEEYLDIHFINYKTSKLLENYIQIFHLPENPEVNSNGNMNIPIEGFANTFTISHFTLAGPYNPEPLQISSNSRSVSISRSAPHDTLPLPNSSLPLSSLSISSKKNYASPSKPLSSDNLDVEEEDDDDDDENFLGSLSMTNQEAQKVQNSSFHESSPNWMFATFRVHSKKPFACLPSHSPASNSFLIPPNQSTQIVLTQVSPQNTIVKLRVGLFHSIESPHSPHYYQDRNPDSYAKVQILIDSSFHTSFLKDPSQFQFNFCHIMDPSSNLQAPTLMGLHKLATNSADRSLNPWLEALLLNPVDNIQSAPILVDTLRERKSYLTLPIQSFPSLSPVLKHLNDLMSPLSVNNNLFSYVDKSKALNEVGSVPTHYRSKSSLPKAELIKWKFLGNSSWETQFALKCSINRVNWSIFLNTKDYGQNYSHIDEFDPKETDPSYINDEQRQALLFSLMKPFTLIRGGPGTGKTFLAAHLAHILYYNSFLNPTREADPELISLESKSMKSGSSSRSSNSRKNRKKIQKVTSTTSMGIKSYVEDPIETGTVSLMNSSNSSNSPVVTGESKEHDSPSTPKLADTVKNTFVTASPSVSESNGLIDVTPAPSVKLSANAQSSSNINNLVEIPSATVEDVSKSPSKQTIHSTKYSSLIHRARPLSSSVSIDPKIVPALSVEEELLNSIDYPFHRVLILTKTNHHLEKFIRMFLLTAQSNKHFSDIDTHSSDFLHSQKMDLPHLGVVGRSPCIFPLGPISHSPIGRYSSVQGIVEQTWVFLKSLLVKYQNWNGTIGSSITQWLTQLAPLQTKIQNFSISDSLYQNILSFYSSILPILKTHIHQMRHNNIPHQQQVRILLESASPSSNFTDAIESRKKIFGTVCPIELQEQDQRVDENPTSHQSLINVSNRSVPETSPRPLKSLPPSQLPPKTASSNGPWFFDQKFVPYFVNLLEDFGKITLASQFLSQSFESQEKRLLSFYPLVATTYFDFLSRRRTYFKYLSFHSIIIEQSNQISESELFPILFSADLNSSIQRLVLFASKTDFSEIELFDPLLPTILSKSNSRQSLVHRFILSGFRPIELTETTRSAPEVSPQYFLPCTDPKNKWIPREPSVRFWPDSFRPHLPFTSVVRGIESPVQFINSTPFQNQVLCPIDSDVLNCGEALLIMATYFYLVTNQNVDPKSISILSATQNQLNLFRMLFDYFLSPNRSRKAPNSMIPVLEHSPIVFSPWEQQHSSYSVMYPGHLSTFENFSCRENNYILLSLVAQKTPQLSLSDPHALKIIFSRARKATLCFGSYSVFQSLPEWHPYFFAFNAAPFRPRRPESNDKHRLRLIEYSKNGIAQKYHWIFQLVDFFVVIHPNFVAPNPSHRDIPPPQSSLHGSPRDRPYGGNNREFRTYYNNAPPAHPGHPAPHQLHSGHPAHPGHPGHPPSSHIPHQQFPHTSRGSSHESHKHHHGHPHSQQPNTSRSHGSHGSPHPQRLQGPSQKYQSSHNSQSLHNPNNPQHHMHNMNSAHNPGMKIPHQSVPQNPGLYHMPHPSQQGLQVNQIHQNPPRNRPGGPPPHQGPPPQQLSQYPDEFGPSNTRCNPSNDPPMQSLPLQTSQNQRSSLNPEALPNTGPPSHMHQDSSRPHQAPNSFGHSRVNPDSSKTPDDFMNTFEMDSTQFYDQNSPFFHQNSLPPSSTNNFSSSSGHQNQNQQSSDLLNNLQPFPQNYTSQHIGDSFQQPQNFLMMPDVALEESNPSSNLPSHHSGLSTNPPPNSSLSDANEKQPQTFIRDLNSFDPFTTNNSWKSHSVFDNENSQFSSDFQ